MGLSLFVRFDIAFIALAGYLLLSIHAFLSASALGELRLTYLSAGPTALRLMLIALTLMMMTLGSAPGVSGAISRPEEHTSELQSLISISYAAFCPNIIKKHTAQ